MNMVWKYINVEQTKKQQKGELLHIFSGQQIVKRYDDNTVNTCLSKLGRSLIGLCFWKKLHGRNNFVSIQVIAIFEMIISWYMHQPFGVLIYNLFILHIISVANQSLISTRRLGFTVNEHFWRLWFRLFIHWSENKTVQ